MTELTRPDLEPGFWSEYVEPRTSVARLVQQPLYTIDGLKLADAYMADWRRARRLALQEKNDER
jgi:hypothetical protein